MTAGNNSHTRYLIIGAGSMGLATADELIRRNEGPVVVLDAHRPPHVHGAHHGETRLIRLAYGEGSGYVPLAKRALDLWQALEQESGETLFLPAGVINAGPPEAPFIRQVAASARAHELPLESLPGDEVVRRWPGWQMDRDMHGCLEARAGVLYVERIIALWRRRVEAHASAELVTGAAVTRLTPLAEGGYEAVCADGRCFRADRVLLAAGQHIAPLMAPLDIALPLTRVRKTFAWYEADARYLPEHFPGFSLTVPGGAIFYGFPDIDGAGFKMGRHDSGQLLAPGEPMLPFGDYEEDIAELQDVVDRYFPGVGALRHGAVCHYIRTPDEHFLIDEPLPGLMIAGGFSGHGFKFASALGEALSEWLVQGQAQPALAGFRLDRFSAAKGTHPA